MRHLFLIALAATLIVGNVLNAQTQSTEADRSETRDGPAESSSPEAARAPGSDAPATANPLQSGEQRPAPRPAAPSDAAGAGSAADRPQAPSREQLMAGLQFGRATAQGLPLTTVAPRSFFYEGGLRPGDVITSYAGQPIRSEADFSRLVTFEAGQQRPVVVLRDGRPETIQIVYNVDGPLAWRVGTAESEGYLGITFEPSLTQRATVREVAPISPAEEAGVQPGDIVTSINGQAVTNWRQVAEAVSAFKPGATLEIGLARPLKVAARPNRRPTAVISAAPAVDVIAPATPLPPAPTPEQ
jgi:S1-C subfamily serine protease